MEPETPGLDREFKEDARFRTVFPPAFFPIAREEAEILTLMAGGMKEASHKTAMVVKVPKGPTTEPRNGAWIPVLTIKLSGVLSQHALDYGSVLDMLITRWANGRATGKTALLRIRDA